MGMLEFYPDHCPTIFSLSPHPLASIRARPVGAARATALLVALTLAACATTGPGLFDTSPPTAPPIPRNVEPPPPPVNLSGFPLPYRQGYADGCASATGAERKDGGRYAGDANYRTGWVDGFSLCRKK
jgi:hypothetical protein